VIRRSILIATLFFYCSLYWKEKAEGWAVYDVNISHKKITTSHDNKERLVSTKCEKKTKKKT
jgi:hypothetical protein